MKELEKTFGGKNVVITGDSGFKGGWLAAVLDMAGAGITGLSFDPDPPHAGISALTAGIDFKARHQVDIRDAAATAGAIHDARPTVLFHLAAQPLVRRSYSNPLETWSTNVLGTAHVLEACRNVPSLKVVVVVTSDKCYENREWAHPYREVDRLGGHDPYSASKACAEIVAASYRESFLSTAGVGIATARAGNVIGGGDFAEDRLIPDAVRAFTHKIPLVLRNPAATRPWQHVLEPLGGYLRLAMKMSELPAGGFDEAWNFGPDQQGAATVGAIAESFASFWPGSCISRAADKHGPHEAGQLQLDNSKAKAKLGWSPRWNLQESLARTAEWYLCWHQAGNIAELTGRQIAAYFRATQ